MRESNHAFDSTVLFIQTRFTPGVMEAEVTFGNSRGRKRSALLSNPSEDLVPIVILCHGREIGIVSKANTALVDIFSQHNIATLRFDILIQTEGVVKLDDRPIEEFVDDILSTIRYLKDGGYTKIGLYGASFYGVVSVLAASRSHDLNVMALKTPGMGQSARKIPQYKIDFDTKSWIKAGQKIKIPTLIVHGTADEKVELQFGKELARSIDSCRLEIIEGGDHGFTKKEDFDTCIDAIAKFIISILGMRA
jgi:dienelactone hydrolase